MRLHAFALASSASSELPPPTIFATVDYFILRLWIKKPDALFMYNLHLPKSHLQQPLLFLRENYAKLLRDVQWIIFA